MKQNATAIARAPFADEFDAALEVLDAHKDEWARTGLAERMRLLEETRDGIMAVAETWAETAAHKKRIPTGSPVEGEEWISGPYATMAGVSALLSTLSQMEGKTFLKDLPARVLPTGQTAITVLPHTVWDRLLLSGITAEVWMQPGVTKDNLARHAALAYDRPEQERTGKVALVLGAGNVSSITPLDVLHKLFLENQVVILKMNPINDYLTESYDIAMKPFIDRGFLRIVKGGADAGAYLAEHPLVAELHITGAAATHDAIVWGTGEEAVRNRRAGTPKNTRRFTSELGSVSPTIVVPGPWSAADIRFQAENIATQKLHNSGHNCIACQALILPAGWDRADALLDAVGRVAAGDARPAYYPGAEQRMATFEKETSNVVRIGRGDGAPPLLIGDLDGDGWSAHNECFAPALAVKRIEARDTEAYLRAAIDYANEQLFGTLGANILIHPRTLKEIGRARFEEIIADFRYGTIAINGWSGIGFLIATCPWGAFPGHTIDDVQSGIGTVHNAFMLENTERVVLEAPWSPFPRNLLSGRFSLLPKPPHFITNRRQHRIGRLLTQFQYRPSWLRLPRIFLNALLG